MSVTYAVIDDYGDEWQERPIAYACDDLDDAYAWAENENYHSASIVRIVNGKRIEKVN